MVIGMLTGLFVVAEIAIALWIDSLVLLSDGFHNLSDVLSLYIAYWAQKVRRSR
jgi:Co/Zn/Cd efflux system component